MNPDVKPEPAWIRITAQNNIPLREGRTVTVGGHEIALFNLGERVLAVRNRCPHRGGPLGDGMLVGDTVVCPLHAWKICLTNGAVTKPTATEARITTYRTRIENGLVYIALPEAEGEESAAA